MFDLDPFPETEMSDEPTEIPLAPSVQAFNYLGLEKLPGRLRQAPQTTIA